MCRCSFVWMIHPTLVPSTPWYKRYVTILTFLQTIIVLPLCCFAASLPCFLTASLCHQLPLRVLTLPRSSTLDWATWEVVRCMGRHTYAPGPRRYIKEGGETSPPPLMMRYVARVAFHHLCTPPVHLAGTDVPSTVVGSCCLPESESSPSCG